MKIYASSDTYHSKKVLKLMYGLILWKAVILLSHIAQQKILATG